VIQPSLVSFRFEVELHRVITSGDGFDVPVDVVIDLDALDIIYVKHCEEVHEHSHGTAVETEDKSVDLHLLGDQAWTLYEEEGIIVALSGTCCIGDISGGGGI
jgi:hypothetical protein